MKMTRLIDADEMLKNEMEAYISSLPYVDTITRGINEIVHNKIVKLINDTPTFEADKRTGHHDT